MRSVQSLQEADGGHHIWMKQDLSKSSDATERSGLHRRLILSSPVLLGLFGTVQKAAAQEQPDDPQPVVAAKGLIEGELGS